MNPKKGKLRYGTGYRLVINWNGEFYLRLKYKPLKGNNFKIFPTLKNFDTLSACNPAQLKTFT